MRNCFFALVALVAVSFASSASAVTISVEDTTPGSQLSIFVDIAPENAKFNNGGIDLRLESSDPSVLNFTGAEVMTPGFLGGAILRWTSGVVQNLMDDSIGLLRGASVGTVGLDPAIPGNPVEAGGTRFLFATVDYTITGSGTTMVTPSGASGQDSFVNAGAIVSNVTLNGIELGGGGPVIPEPATLAMCGMGMIGLVLRRRNG